MNDFFQIFILFRITHYTRQIFPTIFISKFLRKNKNIVSSFFNFLAICLIKFATILNYNITIKISRYSEIP